MVVGRWPRDINTVMRQVVDLHKLIIQQATPCRCSQLDLLGCQGVKFTVQRKDLVGCRRTLFGDVIVNIYLIAMLFINNTTCVRPNVCFVTCASYEAHGCHK